MVGNLFPGKVSFLPAMRYYAGNWDTSLWCFRGAAIDKMDANLVKASLMPHQQLEKIYGAEQVALTMHLGYAFRACHTHGRALFTLVPRACGPGHEEYFVIDGEMVAGTALGWNFGDGHLHNEQLIDALQKRCHFEPGEVRVVILEAQPFHKRTQAYRLVDAATGELERGYVEVKDLVSRQPTDHDVPVHVTSSAPANRVSLDAVVVGSGPNGLAAAVALAQAGRSVTVLEGEDTIGGGTRTAELTLPGLLHDVCSAVHPFGVASPFLTSLPLAEHGLVWRHPEVDLAHPLDDGTAGVLVRSLDETCAGLGPDGKAWRGVFGPLIRGFDELAGDVLGPVLRWPGHPLRMARFGLRAGLPATVLATRFRTPQARALFGGSAAHIFRPLNRPASASVGVMLTAAGHVHGWPVPEGGSTAITSALASLLTELGGTVVTGHRVRGRADLPAARVTLFDTGPETVAEVYGDALPGRTRPRLPPLPARSGGVQGRPRGPRRRAVDQRGGAQGGHGARRRHAGGDRRRRGGGLRRADAGAAVRPRRPAVAGRPDARRG